MTSPTIQLQASFYKKLDILDEKIEAKVKKQTVSMAKDAVSFSKPFTRTGAFITSWQIHTGGRGRPRGKSSHGLPLANKEAKAKEALSQLMADVARIDLKNTTRIVLRNGAPHARYVDAKHSHVMARLRNRYG